MSVSINMSSIPNSEPAPSAAHSPNSNEEVEAEVDSDNSSHIQECFLVKLNRTLHEKLGVIKEFQTILILVFILIGFLYNYFTKEERDLSDFLFHILYKLVASASGVPISTEPSDDSNREWENPSKAKLLKELDKIYYRPDEEGYYCGIQKLLRAAKAKGLKVFEKSIIDYLCREASYSLHKPSRKNFKRNLTVVGGIDQQWLADLADMQSLPRKNKGTKYILTVIDVLSI